MAGGDRREWKLLKAAGGYRSGVVHMGNVSKLIDSVHVISDDSDSESDTISPRGAHFRVRFVCRGCPRAPRRPLAGAGCV